MVCMGTRQRVGCIFHLHQNNNNDDDDETGDAGGRATAISSFCCNPRIGNTSSTFCRVELDRVGLGTWVDGWVVGGG